MADAGGESWRFDALSRDALAQIAGEATAVVPLGSTEQHGHHLPVRADTTIVTRIAERAVARAAERVPVVLVPAVPFGFAHHHLQFGATISIGSLTYVSLLTDIVSSLAAGGFRRVVLLNGHGGNIEAMELAADRLGYEQRVEVQVAATSYWTAASRALEEAGLMRPRLPGHAGHFETSLLLAICPGLVHLDQRPTDAADHQVVARAERLPGVIRRPGLWEVSDGRSDDARTASREYGMVALDVICEAVADYIEQFHLSTS